MSQGPQRLITTLECVREGKSKVRGIEMSTVADPPAVVNPTAVPAMRASIVKSPKLWLATIPGDQILIGLLILLAAVCYGNSLFNGFVYDDEQQILQNPYVKSWHYLPQIIGTTVWSFIGAAGTTNYYRPLMTFTYLLLWQFFKDIPSALIFSMSR